jgi:HAD superfamily phosphatase
VLVDVTESYRETICQTVGHFTGRPASREEIQDLKNQGGFNDDWKVSHHLIRQRGVDVPFESVVDYFQNLFHGNGSHDGLILRERWLAREGLLESLADRYRLAVFTGRMKWEAEVTLKRFAPHLIFDPIVGMEEVANHKPAPDGLLLCLEQACECPVWYVGDTVDDARCARAAGVPFVGIAAPSNPRHDEVVTLLRGENAAAILNDINGLPDVLP